MLPNWIERIVFYLLIICVGGVGSITYFDAFLPGHGPHPYHLSILENRHPHNPLPPPPRAATGSLTGQFTGQPVLGMGQGLMPGLTQFFQSGLNNGYLLAEGQITIDNTPALADRVLTDILPGRSALLLPPDKPPTFYPILPV